MKRIVVIGLMLITAHISQAGQNTSPAACINAIARAFSLAPGQKVEFKTSTCELHVSSSQFSTPSQQNVNGLQIEQFYLRDQQIDPQKIHDGIPDYQMVTWLDAEMDDRINGLNEYIINDCSVSPDQIHLKYTQHQLFGWHSKFKFEYQIALKNGKASSVTSTGDAGRYSETCNF